MLRTLCSITALLLGSLIVSFARAQESSAQESSAELIRELSSDRHSKRLAAEKKLWKLGPSIVPELQNVVDQGEPEPALRATKILRYLHWGLTPETPEEIIKLTERFPQLTEDQKKDAYASLVKMREYRLALLLFRSEKDESMKLRTRNSVRGLAILSARASVLAGKPEEAKKTLQEFQDDPQNRIALAWLARAEGRLDQEIAKVSKKPDREQLDYHLALLRAQGNRQAIAEFAEKNDFTALHASMELLEGRPEQWLRWYSENSSAEHSELVATYQQISEMRSKNPKADVSERLNTLTKAALKGDDNTRRWSAINALNALGEIKSVDKAVKLINPSDIFTLYVSTEKIDEALKALELDPQDPDYHAWLNKAMDQILRGEMDYGMNSIPLVLDFLERRDIMDPIKDVFVPKMLELAEDDSDSFLALVDSCFSPHLDSAQAPESAILVAESFAEENAERWGSMIERAFGLADSPNPGYQKWFDLLSELHPEETKFDVFRRTLQLFRIIPISDQGLEKLEQTLERHFQKAKKEDQEASRRLLLLLATHTQVTRYSAWLEKENHEPDTRELMEQERWEEAAAQWLEHAKTRPDDIEYISWAAACLHKAGKREEAAEQERLMDFLVMGDSNMMFMNSAIYQTLGVHELADQWRIKHLNCSRTDQAWINNVFTLADQFLLEGKYQQAHAYYQAFLLSMISNQNSGYLTITHRYSNKAQMAQGFALLAKDRELAMKILRACHQSMIADASLADEFFPNLRKNRLLKEHDSWFEESWQEMMSIAKRFPQDDNIHNSAAWLACRSLRRLDDAEQQSKIALELRPNQAAYLDTMAEIWFARRDRAKAVEWSRKAIAADPSQELLKEQFFRFQSANFPQ